MELEQVALKEKKNAGPLGKIKSILEQIMEEGNLSDVMENLNIEENNYNELGLEKPVWNTESSSWHNLD